MMVIGSDDNDTGKNRKDRAAVGLEGRAIGVRKFALFHF